MKIHEAALHHERTRELAASSGQDNPFLRVGVRSDEYDDNGEPLCSVPASREVHGDKWPTMPSVSPIATPTRLPRPIERPRSAMTMLSPTPELSKRDEHSHCAASRCWAPSAWLCREASGSEYLLYLGGEEAKPTRLQRPGRGDAWTWGNGFENVVIFTPSEWAKISPVTLAPGEGPVAVCGGFFLPNTQGVARAAQKNANE